MLIDFAELSPGRIYHTLIGLVVPRPIAWVLSENGDQHYNLAPFSFFNVVSHTPALMMLAVGRKPDGVEKDTLQNLQERRHFVAHLPHAEQATAVTESSRVLSWGDSELDRLNLSLEEIPGHPLPRVAGCRAALLGEFHSVIQVDDAPQRLVLAHIRAVHVDDRIVQRDAKGRMRFDTQTLRPLARLGGNDYAVTGRCHYGAAAALIASLGSALEPAGGCARDRLDSC